MSLTMDKLYELHEALGCPGVTRMLHFVKSKNLPFSVDDIKSMVRACKVCSELKPQYDQTDPFHLIKSVISNLCALFSVFGMPSYIHSDRGSSFMSSELKTFLYQKRVATSRTTSCNPAGNGQVERLNNALWKRIMLILRSRKLPITYW